MCEDECNTEHSVCVATDYSAQKSCKEYNSGVKSSVVIYFYQIDECASMKDANAIGSEQAQRNYAPALWSFEFGLVYAA